MNNLKIGFFGGCFNPPTIAHIELAKKAIEVANLDKVIFIPMGDCYSKDDLISIKHRYEMLKIAIDGEEKLEISNMQFTQKEKVYAIDTFREIDKMYSCQKYFIMGTDNFAQLKNWKESDKLRDYKLIILERKEKIVDENITFVSTNKFTNVSSKEIREQIKNGKEKITLLKKEVLEYIQKNNLYSF